MDKLTPLVEEWAGNCVLEWHNQENYGATALCAALCNGHEASVRLLISAGASVNADIDYGLRPRPVWWCYDSKCLQLLKNEDAYAGKDCDGTDWWTQMSVEGREDLMEVYR